MLRLVCAQLVMASLAVAIVSPNTSLATLPVGYFGGVSVPRPPENLAMLAKMRVVTIEKWEGGAFDACAQNASMGIPCSAEAHGEALQLATIRAVKQLNPAVSVGYYQNSLYDWTFQLLDAEFGAADENMRSVNNSIITMEQDNGLTGQHVFALEKPAAVQRWLNWHRTLLSMGIVDGIFLDKPNIVPVVNASTPDGWQLCEANGNDTQHTWEQRCAPVTAEQAAAYTTNKLGMVKSVVEDIWRPAGGYVLTWNFGNGTMDYFHGLAGPVAKLNNSITESLAQPHTDYVYINLQDLHTNSTATTPLCTMDDVAKFLIVVRERMFLGCNGWDESFGNPLGDPLGPATSTGDRVYVRKFASGTSATFDEKTGTGSISWATV